MSEPTVLPDDFVVERRGMGDERHVFLSIEGTTFELRADDAYALGRALVRIARTVETDDEAAE